jgi:hypothetical protein
MKLPNAENAFVEIRKLTEYCLDPNNPRGRHKARVFKAALGITRENAEVLKTAILNDVPRRDAVIGEQDFYGQRYTVDCKIETEIGEEIVRTGWITKRSEDFPRLTTCYVVKRRGDER